MGALLTVALSSMKRFPWIKVGLPAAAALLVFVLLVLPAWSDLKTVRGDLNTRTAQLVTAQADLLAARAATEAERLARSAANEIALTRKIERDELARELDAARAQVRAATSEIASNARRRTRDADTDWSSQPIPGAVAISLCRGLAAISAGGNGIHHADCGSEPDDDAGDGD